MISKEDICKESAWQATLPSLLHRFGDKWNEAANTSIVNCQQGPKQLTTEALCVLCLILIFVMLCLIGSSINAYESLCKAFSKKKTSRNLKRQKKRWKRGNNSNERQTFSGFLTAYLFSDYFEKNNGKISWISFYAVRFLRITPVYLAVLGFYSTLFTYIGSSPIWPTYNTNPVCKETWMWNLLYINNFNTHFNQLTLSFGWIMFTILIWFSLFAFLNREESVWEAAAYNGVKSVLFSCSFAWLIFICATKQGGPVNKFLSYPLFKPISRLSFCGFLTQAIVFEWYFLSVDVFPDEMEVFNVVWSLIWVPIFARLLVWTLVSAFCASLLFEYPTISLSQIYFSGKKKKA